MSISDWSSDVCSSDLNDGIVLGKKSGKFLTFDGNEHCIVEAPTRSGKGVGIVIPNLLSWQESVVVLDVKRENWEATAGFRQKYGQAVYLFNPTDPEGRRSEEHTSELQSLMRISYAVFCLKKKNTQHNDYLTYIYI